MLGELAVRNFALIEDVRIDLADGFCAWTGETGAGKSLLLSAIGLLLGHRSSVDLIRVGEEELEVAGRFDLSRPQLFERVAAVLGREPENAELILRRKLNRAGRGSAWIDDTPATPARLRELAPLLIDIHGQRESQRLLDPGYQLAVLDSFGRLAALRADWIARADALRELRKTCRALEDEQNARSRELEQLREDRQELAAAELEEGELERLAAERLTLSNARSLRGFAAFCYNRLDAEEGSVGDQIGRLNRESHSCGRFDPRIAAIAERIDAVAGEVRDIADTCRDLGDSFEADPARLTEVEDRIQLLRRLEGKYRRKLPELIAHFADLQTRESQSISEQNARHDRDKEVDRHWRELVGVGAKLSEGRAASAKRLAKETQKHLARLGMPLAVLDARLERDPPAIGTIPEAGFDRIDLMLCANPGEATQPLRKVASGGELSRTMLALKAVLAEYESVGTIIFDEIDANVGGRLGDVLGEQLAALAVGRQVICVTHLPQVAAFARSQWTIRKRVRGQRTTATIVALDRAEGRVDELCRMLRGDRAAGTTRDEAISMLHGAGNFTEPSGL